MPGLVQDPEQRRAEVVLVVAPGQAHVVAPEAAAERVRRGVDAPAREVEAEALGDVAREGELALDGEVAARRAGVGATRGAGRGAHARHELARELREQRADLVRARARLVLVEQRVVERRARRRQEPGLLARQRDQALERGAEAREVARRARRHPGLVSFRGGLGARRECLGDARRSRELPARLAHLGREHAPGPRGPA